MMPFCQMAAVAVNELNTKVAFVAKVKYYYVCEKVLDNTIKLNYCPTLDMLIDMMTKDYYLTTNLLENDWSNSPASHKD